MNKLQRYSAVTKTGIETVCLDADVSALEAENERLLEERQRLLAWLEIKKDEGLARPVYSAVKAELRAILNTPAASRGRT